MAQPFDRAIVTNEGFKLLAKAQAGLCKIVFTNIATGDGIYTEEEKRNLLYRTELKNKKNAFTARVEVGNDNNMRAKALITNRDPYTKEILIRDGYYINEMGLYAKEDTENATEILYSIVTTSGIQGDFIPGYVSGAPARINQSWAIAVQDSDIVKIEVVDDMFATKDELNAFKSEVRDTLKNAIEEIGKKANAYKMVDVIVLASNWTGSEPPYINELVVQGVTSLGDIQIMPRNTISTEQAEAWMGAAILSANQTTDSINLRAFGEKPSIDIPVTVLIGSDVLGGA